MIQTNINRAILAAIALVSLTVNAADLSVFGFELGKPLNLPECPNHLTSVSKTRIYDQLPLQTCFQEPHNINGYGVPVRTIVFAKAESPLIVSYWRLVALESDGILIGVRFATLGVTSQDVVTSQLTAKYGKATSTSSEKVQNLMGAQFESVTALWRGGAVDVTYLGTVGTLDKGEVTIDLPQATALRRSWQNLDRGAERKL